VGEGALLEETGQIAAAVASDVAAAVAAAAAAAAPHPVVPVAAARGVTAAPVRLSPPRPPPPPPSFSPLLVAAVAAEHGCCYSCREVMAATPRPGYKGGAVAGDAVDDARSNAFGVFPLSSSQRPLPPPSPSYPYALPFGGWTHRCRLSAPAQSPVHVRAEPCVTRQQHHVHVHVMVRAPRPVKPHACHPAQSVAHHVCVSPPLSSPPPYPSLCHCQHH